MTDANTPRDRADEGDARDRAPREPARDPLDDAAQTSADGPAADGPAVDFGSPAASGAPAVDFGAPAGADRPAVDFGAPASGPAEPAVAPEDRVENSGVDDRDRSAYSRGDDAQASSPDSSTESSTPPAGSFGDSTSDGRAVPGASDADDDAAREGRVDDSGIVDGRAADGAGAASGATTVPDPSTADERPADADERTSSDHADTEVLHDRVETVRSDDDARRDADADRRDADGRDSDGRDADRRDDDVPVVPPVVAPTPPASRAWSAAPQDDSGRPLHDDDALRAAEAHSAPGPDAHSRPVDGTADDADRRDADRRDADATVVAPAAAPGRGDDAPTTSWRTDDGRVAGRPGGAGPATGSQAYPLVAETADPVALRRELLTEQKQEFSGMRFGAGLLGWFAATGFGVSVFVVFAAIASAVVAASSGSSPDGFRGFLGDNAEVLSITTGIVVLVIVFAGYFVGGFTASRVARFSGFKQGLATWLWGLVITIVVGVIGAVVGVQAGDQSAPNPMVPSMDDLSSTSVESFVFLGLLVVLSFGGAVLGGLLGQRWHRKVDRFVPEHQV
jgi:hypothetical protein